MADCTVSLMPHDPEGNKWFSGGMTDQNGIARIRTHGKFDGAPADSFKVYLRKESIKGETVGPEPFDKSPEERAEYRRRAVEIPKEYSLVEKQYTLPETTPCQIQVEAKKVNYFEFDIGKAVEEPVSIPPVL